MGGYLLSAEQARAGTKRLSNLLHSAKWQAQLISDFLWQQASSFVTDLAEQGEEALVLWDESVWEKPESEQLEGLCSVRSSKAARLSRGKKGAVHRKRKPICVPGMNWLGLVVVGSTAALGPPVLAAMRWWSSQGPLASRLRLEEGRLLLQCMASWGSRALHIFDRGFAGSPWLGACLALLQRVVIRWPMNQYLRDEKGHLRKPGQIARGKRSWSQRQIWDAHRHRWQLVGVVAFAVQHPQFDRQLWLVVSRPGQGRKPWYLLTTQEVKTQQQAWKIVLAYSRRWQIEMTWRYAKSELGFECPRVRHCQERDKLLLMASLAYAFLLSLFKEEHRGLRVWLLRHYCHRTGLSARRALLPLYRLRLGLSRLWQRYRPQFGLLGRRCIPGAPAP